MTRTMRQAEIHDSAGCSVCGWSAGGRSGLPAPHRPPAVWGVPGLGQAGDALGEEAGAVDLLGDAGAVKVRGDAAEVERPAGAEIMHRSMSCTSATTPSSSISLISSA